jgi:hypothetical protein
MRFAPYVLFVGSAEPFHMVYSVFLEQRGCMTAVAACYRDLCVAPLPGDCHVVVLHHTLCPGELRETARFVRQRWPEAKILMIRAEAWCIDDPLYDERISPGVHPEILLLAIQCLSGRCEVVNASEQQEAAARQRNEVVVKMTRSQLPVSADRTEIHAQEEAYG